MTAAAGEGGREGSGRGSLQTFLYRNVAVLSILGVLLLLILVFSVTTDAFLSSNNILNLLRQNAPTMIVAVAMTFVITSAGIDLSVGSTVALTAALSAVMLAYPLPVELTIPAMLLLGLVVGFINGWFSAYQGIPAFIVTLAMLSIVRGIALFQTRGYSISIDPALYFVGLGQGRLGPIPVPVVIALVVALLGWIGLTKTKYGQYVTGIGSNEEAVRRAGVNTRLVKLSVYMLTGLASALAGMMVAARLASGSANAAQGFELEAIAAVVLGGTNLFGGRGTIVGTVLGALTIGVIGNGLILMRVSPFLVSIVQGAILLLAIWANTRVFSRFNGTGGR
jgi:simple sugar transport system permease protein